MGTARPLGSTEKRAVGNTQHAPACTLAEFEQCDRVVKPLRSLIGGLLLLMGLSAAFPVRAVILFGSGDPLHNTTPPVGVVADSGWQWQTDGGFCATAVGPHHAVTARHLGLGGGSVLSFAGLTFPVVSVANAPGSDFQLVELAGRLPGFAPLYTGADEVGRMLVLHGRGTQRGDAVLAPDGGAELRGWRWGGYDGRLRWGTNTVAGTDAGTSEQGLAGELLIATFGPTAIGDTGTFSTGDSGGGDFLMDDDGLWKLAGINYAVQGSFNTTTNGGGFFAALFDRRGFFEQNNDNLWAVDETQADEPGTVLIATRVSSYAAWVAEKIAQPTDIKWPVLQSAATVEGPFAEHSSYAVNPAKQQITVTVPTGDQFFRLDGAPVLAPPVRQGAQLVFSYH